MKNKGYRENYGLLNLSQSLKAWVKKQKEYSSTLLLSVTLKLASMELTTLTLVKWIVQARGVLICARVRVDSVAT